MNKYMGNNIMVSVLCSTYNHERYVAHAIESFLMQKTNFAFEILIYDDASTDSTPDIIKRYAEKHPDIIKPILQSENQMSKGINVNQTYQYPRAKGKYIAFCEGDDYWIDENKLQFQVEWLESHLEDVACVHKYIVVDEDEKIQNIKTFGYYEKEERYSLEDFEMKELPSQLASLVCRNIFMDSQKGYPEEFITVKIQGDIKLYLYLLAHGSVYRLPQTYSAYRFIVKKGGNSWSSRNIGVAKGYRDWMAYQELEKIFCEKYEKKISLNNRKVMAAVTTVSDFFHKRTLENLKNAISVMLHQKGCLSYMVKVIWKKIK
ncbi:glycosyltransferase family 2 protein [Dorea sp.]